MLLALAGVGLLTWALLRGRARADGLGRPGTWIAAGLVLAFGYVTFGVLAKPFSDLVPGPHRALPLAVAPPSRRHTSFEIER